MVDIDGLLEAVQHAFVPETAHDLRELLEGLPSFLAEITEKTHQLAESMDAEGAHRSAGEVHGVGTHLGAASEAATVAFLAFEADAAFWFGG